MTIKRWQTNYISATIQISKLNYRKLSSNSSEQIIEMGKNGKRKLQMKREREKKGKYRNGGDGKKSTQ